jgi:hypothetical protein
VRRGAEPIADVVDAAVGLLVAGIDTPNLRILAGEDRADRTEVENVLAATLRDFGREPLDHRAAALLVARDLAASVVADDRRAAEIAPAIWRLYADVGLSAIDWPEPFVRLAHAADSVVDLPWWEGSMPNFLASAQAFLDSDD